MGGGRAKWAERDNGISYGAHGERSANRDEQRYPLAHRELSGRLAGILPTRHSRSRRVRCGPERSLSHMARCAHEVVRSDGGAGGFHVGDTCMLRAASSDAGTDGLTRARRAHDGALATRAYRRVQAASGGGDSVALLLPRGHHAAAPRSAAAVLRTPNSYVSCVCRLV